MKASMIAIGSLMQVSRVFRITLLVAVFTTLAGCSTLFPPQEAAPAPAASATTVAPPPAAPPPVAPPVAVAPPPPAPPPGAAARRCAAVGGEQSVLSASKTLAAPPAQRVVVIDPLVDGVSHTQTVTTQSLETKIQGLVKSKYPGFNAQPFSRATVGQAPIVLVGTFAAIDLKNQTGGVREAFRICLALADLKSGVIVAKGVARAKIEGVDLTPLPHLQDAPAWTKDPSVDAYVRTCQTTKPGDRIEPAYLDGILAASLIAEASDLFRRWPLPGGNRRLPQRAFNSEGRSAARAQRHLQRELEARPPRRCRARVRRSREGRACQPAPGREVSVPPGLD